MGMGKTMAEFWFDPMSSSVCMYRRARAAGCVEMISALARTQTRGESGGKKDADASPRKDRVKKA
jgi:hypothetical protein